MYLTIWKISGGSGKFPESLESFWTVLRVSSSVKSFRTVWKISRHSWKFPDSLESFRTVKSFLTCVPLYTCRVCAFGTCAHLCSKSHLRNFSVFLSRQQYTHSVQRVFARDILATGKFVVLCLCWCHYVPQFCMQFTTWRPCRPWWDKQAGNASLFQMQLLGCR